MLLLAQYFLFTVNVFYSVLTRVVSVVMQFLKKRMKLPDLILSTCQYTTYKHTGYKIHYHSPDLNMYRMGDCFTKRLGPGHPLW